MARTAMDNDRRKTVNATFGTAALWISQQSGRPATFAAACAVISVWALTGPVFAYSDTWQLIINTSTTIVTFLMVFLIQNTQNRDMSALHLKLDELIRVSETARNRLLTLEDMTEEELARLKGTFSLLAAVSRENDLLREAASDLDSSTGEIQRASHLAAAVTNGKY